MAARFLTVGMGIVLLMASNGTVMFEMSMIHDSLCVFCICMTRIFSRVSKLHSTAHNLQETQLADLAMKSHLDVT